MTVEAGGKGEVGVEIHSEESLGQHEMQPQGVWLSG